MRARTHTHTHTHALFRYGVYSKPLFDRGEASSVYRPKRDDAEMYGDGDTQYNDLANVSLSCVVLSVCVCV